MQIRKHFFLLACACSTAVLGIAQKQVDICIYGGTSAGVIAAYTAKKMHKTVLLVEPGKHLGGLTSGGLGYTDIGNKYAITGLSRDFYRRVGLHYHTFEQWIFEPHVAEQEFQRYIQEAQVDVLYQYQVTKVNKQKTAITEMVVEPSGPGNKGASQIIRAGMFIDCSYEGDLMALAGVSYTVGREANDMYQETYNGVQLKEKHQFPDGIDPYKIPGNPGSGLLWGISNETLAPQGSGDKKVQSYNFRICLTSDPSNQVAITRPEGYDSTRYELLLRVLDKKPAKDLWAFLKFDLMPNNKTDINNNGAFSTDMIGMNYDYPGAGYARRKTIFNNHTAYTKGFLYFIGHDPRMPVHLRTEMLKWGYPKDEYTDNGNWTTQLYVREARRMKGAYIMTQANCEGRTVVTDTAGMAAYTMDSHNTQRLVVNGMVKNEGDVQIGGFGPYPISYRAIVPQAPECSNLLVPVCLSATHIAYGSIRMEPVFMVLAQSSAVAASLALDAHCSVQQVNIPQLRQILRSNPLADGSTPEILVDNDDKAHTHITGDWATIKNGGYGPDFLADTSRGAIFKSVQFNPAITTAGRYTVYAYFPKLQHGSTQTSIRVFDGTTTTEKTIAAAGIEVKGQTSGEWVALGTYGFLPRRKAYIEISNKHADNTIAADAILLVPVK